MKSRRDRRRHDRGLTLLEMMIVLALIGLLAGTIGQQIYKRYQEGQIRTTRIQVRELMGTVQEAMVDDHTCPTIEGLVARQALRKIPHDSWGTPLAMECPSKEGKDPVDVSSAGPDKKLGTEDDIQSWKL